MTIIDSWLLYQCPRCNYNFITPGYASTNNFGMDFWSDGSTFHTPNFINSVFVKCSRCDHAFWLTHQKPLNLPLSAPLDSYTKKHQTSVESADVEDMLKELENNNLSMDDRKYLLVNAIGINNYSRRNNSDLPTTKSVELFNEFIHLINPPSNNFYDDLLCVDYLRELSLWDQSKALISEFKPIDERERHLLDMQLKWINSENCSPMLYPNYFSLLYPDFDTQW